MFTPNGESLVQSFQVIFFISQVVRDRVRVHEWMRDYDKLRCGRMHKLSFRRALDLCKFELKESEMALLEDK